MRILTFLLFLLLLNSCIGTKPLGIRHISFTTTRSYFSKGKPKEIVHTRRVYIKDCPGCKEIVKTRKKQYLETGRVAYKEKMKRRMYTAKLLKIKSKTYYDDGTIKEHTRLRHGRGYSKSYDQNGKLFSKKHVPEKKKKTGKQQPDKKGDQQ